MQLTIIFLLFI